MKQKIFFVKAEKRKRFLNLKAASNGGHIFSYSQLRMRQVSYCLYKVVS